MKKWLGLLPLLVAAACSTPINGAEPWDPSVQPTQNPQASLTPSPTPFLKGDELSVTNLEKELRWDGSTQYLRTNFYVNNQSQYAVKCKLHINYIIRRSGSFETVSTVTMEITVQPFETDHYISTGSSKYANDATFAFSDLTIVTPSPSPY